uniref:Uncharacterized protein n=1 Tax=Echeneis naucrates TaxID=173247 RepID=A0A665W8Z3_ECHNA
MATFMDRLAFLQKVPTLMKATADDDRPCPGYLFQEIGKISHESLGCGQCLLEYLLERLQVESCHVKLKVLKIFVHLCGHGSNYFLTELRRNSTFIQQASVYSGPPDPIHGTALYQKVRNTAQVRHSLYLITMSPGQTYSQSFFVCRKWPGSGSDSILDKIQKAAEVVASAVLPPTEHQGIRLHENHYRAVVAPSAPIEVAVPACAYNLPAHRPKAVTQWCPGQVGGGWEETDSGNSSSHNSSQDIAANSRMSVGSKSAGTGSQSGASRESSGDLSERVEALQLGDCGQEVALISGLTEGSRVFLSREESQHFIKECAILNCEVVMELLSSKLQDPSHTRALCAVACLMTSDLLSLERMYGATQRRLHQLSEGAPGPVVNKATKILRQFEALMGGPLNATRQDTAHSNRLPTTIPAATSTYSDPSIPTQSADHTNLVHYQPGTSPLGVTQLPNHKSTSPSSLALAQRDSPLEPLNNNDEGKHVVIQPEPNRTAVVKRAAKDPELTRKRESSPPCEQPRQHRLSLFSGMELVTKGRLLCNREEEISQTQTKLMADDLKENPDVHNSDNPVDSTSTPPGTSKTSENASSDSSPPVSAFSFLKF